MAGRGAMDYSKFDGIGQEIDSVLAAYAPGGSACAQPKQPAGAPGKPPAPDDQLDGELRGWVELVQKHRLAPPESAAEPIAALRARVARDDAQILQSYDNFVAEAARQLSVSDDRLREWKEKGNAAFKAKRHETAAVLYTRAVQEAAGSGRELA
eukprot:gene7913-11562_t